MKSKLFFSGTACSQQEAGLFADGARWLPSLLLLCTFTASVQAQFEYSAEGDTITITRYTGPGGAVTIPDTLEGLPVTTIGESAFRDCTELTSVTMLHGYGFMVSWATNASVVVEACTNLDEPAWVPVSTNTLTAGTATFSDPDWSQYSARHYRARGFALSANQLNRSFWRSVGSALGEWSSRLFPCPTLQASHSRYAR